MRHQRIDPGSEAGVVGTAADRVGDRMRRPVATVRADAAAREAWALM